MKKLSFGITTALLFVTMIQFTSCEGTQRENPFLQESTLDFGAPDFSKIQPSNYLPAFEM